MMQSLNSIAVFGLGKLGSCIAATLAAREFNITGVDIDAEKVRRVNAGEPPVEEPLLAETIRKGRGRLRATTDVREAQDTDASFYIPPSPSLLDGSFSSEFLLRAMQPMARAIRATGKTGHLFVVNSTTTPGAMRNVILPTLEHETGWTCGREFGLCYNPEFIALGNVIRGLLEPDMVLIGESDAASGERLADLYRRYNTNRPHMARMSLTSAELTKISVNSYITMKISFTNQLRLIAGSFPDANIHDILAAIGSDSRIGSKFLRSGLSYGGPCFPRDNRLVAYTARQRGLEAPLAEATDRLNESTKDSLVEQVLSLTSPGDTVVILGMAYRPDTYIVEESAGLFLAQHLKQRGCRLLVHDYQAKPDNSPSLIEFENLDSPDALLQHSKISVVVICCPWPQYSRTLLPPDAKLIDPWGIRRFCSPAG
ncbi:MAG: nucleotide sugar dehydrogenase [Verrucomicrobiota bacterium]|nr:nucleotide sugar dehydrogenase [Verrucomicrobiota bacterium]